MFTLITFAIFSGIMTVLSPCILPLLPLLLSAGASSERKKPLGIIIGLMISFSFFTLSLTTIIKVTGISPTTFRYGAIIFIIFSGLAMIFPALNTYTNYLTSGLSRLGETFEKIPSQSSELINGLITGIALGLLWSPCAGPILATITSLAATQSINWKIALLTLSYSFGAAIPMFFITYGGNKIIQMVEKVSPYTKTIRKLFGMLMIISALTIAFNVDKLLQILTLKYFPTIIIDDTTIVKKELDMMRSQKSGLPLLNQQAPELVGITEWLNSPALSLKELRGKIVLLDFWTYSCINCIRTLAHLTKLYEKYKNNDFVLIGIHTPEFAFEKTTKNVHDAIQRFNITYPVALDSDYATWNAYNNRYWPTHYLINKQGIIVDIHSGEGGYIKTENMIRTLLELATMTETCQPETINAIVTPEIYLGYQRAQNYHTETMLTKDTTTRYNYTTPLSNDHVGLKGLWLATAEFIRSESDESTLTLNFFAEQVCMVMSSPTPQTITILDDEKILKTISIHEPRMYNVFKCKEGCARHIFTFTCPKGVTIYTITFR